MAGWEELDKVAGYYFGVFLSEDYKMWNSVFPAPKEG